MKLFRVLVFTFFICFIFSANAQKVKLKKGVVTIDKVEYLKYEKVNGSKYFFSTLDDEEFLSITFEKYGTGKHHAVRNPVAGQDTEIYHHYSVFKFLDNDEIGEEFEVDEARIKKLILMMKKSKIIVDGKLSVDKAKRMIEKYSEKVTERRFLTKN
jgi:hypothetical protein